MRKLLLFFLAASLIAFSCNNNKEKSSGKKGEKDNYLNGKEGDNEDSEDSDNDNSSQWSSGDIRKFNSECAKGMENEGIGQDLIDKICPCVLEKVSNRWSSFAKADETGNTSAIAKMTEDCVSELGLGNKNNANTGDDDNSGSWSASDERLWMSQCRQETQQLDAGTQTSYCSCVLEKLKGKFSGMDDLNRRGTEQMGINLGKQCLSELGITND